MKKKIISFLLSLALFVGLVPTGLTTYASAEAFSEIDPLGEREVYYSIDSRLSTSAEAAFEATVYSALVACKAEINVSNHNFTVSQCDSELKRIKDKYPELYHMCGFVLSGSDTNKNGALDSYEEVSKIKPEYYFNATTYAKYNSSSKQAAAEILADIKDNASLNTLERLLLLHDRIAVICEYDFANYEAYIDAVQYNPYVSSDDFIPPESYSMYGAIVKGVAVCEGYAKTYQYLLNQLGIENYLCVSTELNHVWNIVKLAGEYYHVDITWDDPSCSLTPTENEHSTDRTGTVSHLNFLRSTNGIKATGHQGYGSIDYDSTPTDTTYDNYFWQNSITAFTLLNGDLYYIDNNQETLNIWNYGATPKSIYDVSDYWYSVEGGYYTENYACLSGDSEYLYFNLSKDVYRYDAASGTAVAIYTPETEGYESIYGFKAYHGEYYCDIAETPQYFASEKKAGLVRHAYTTGNIDISTSAGIALAEIVKSSTYTGSAITFGVDIFAGGKHLYANRDYKVSYANNVNKGTATVTVSGIGNYKGVAKTSFAISAAAIKNATVKNIVDKAYTGNKVYQTPYITYKGKVLTPNKDYKLTHSKNKATGKASVKITGIGNFKGNVTKYFYIRPKKVKTVKVKKATATAVKLKWSSTPSGTGYAVLRATAKKGTYKTLAFIKSLKQTSYTDKNVAKNKTYYYKIVAYKTVGGKKYTSVASPIVTAKTATAKPKITYGKNSSANAAKIKWGKVKGATGYQVYIKKGSGSYKKVYSGTKLTYTAKKLKKGSTYTFKVRTYKTFGSKKAYSSFSAVKKVKINK